MPASQLNRKLQNELLQMMHEDHAVRERLLRDGSLYGDYHPEMQTIHAKNAIRLSEILNKIGWPSYSLVGEDGERAAWLVAQHAINFPELMRQSFVLLKNAALIDEAPLWQVAMLEDRIRFFEGRCQIYGTQFDWDESGELSPFPQIEDPVRVDELRAQMGLEHLELAIQNKQKEAREMNERPPHDLAERRAKMKSWAKSVGWCD